MAYIMRNTEKKFLALSASHKAVLLVGARKVGKTTMLRHLEEKGMLAGSKGGRKYVTLDNMMARDLAKSDPAAFFRTYQPPILIAEIQYAPELLVWIREMCDDRVGMGMFWLTSSQWDTKMKREAAAMGGKLGVLEMHGLSRREAEGLLGAGADAYSLPHMLRQRVAAPGYDLNKLFEYIWRGGMPGLRNDSAERRAAYLEAYIDNHVTRDATYLGGVTDALRFRKFVAAAAAHNGMKLNYKTLAEVAGISQPTAKEWLSILEGMGIVYLLRPYQHESLKRLVKTAKLYFCDTGLCAYLAGLHSPEALQQGEAGERYLANYIIMELIKNYAGGHTTMDLTFYRNAKAKEIALLLEEDQVVHPFGIRLSSRPEVREVRKFNILEKAGIRRGRGGILCPVPTIERIHGENYLIPCDLI